MTRTEYRKAHWADLRSGDMYQGDDPEPGRAWWILPAAILGGLAWVAVIRAIYWSLT